MLNVLIAYADILDSSCENAAIERKSFAKSALCFFTQQRKKQSVNEQRLKQYRQPYKKEILFVRALAYVATAAFFAAAASDFASQASASALGNLGLVLILMRSYFLAGYIVSIAKNGDPQWQSAELEDVARRYPWTGRVANIGWMLLVAAVVLQLFFGYA